MSSAYDSVRKLHLVNSVNGPTALETADILSSSLVLLPKELFEMLACAGPYLYRDTLLLQKVRVPLATILPFFKVFIFFERLITVCYISLLGRFVEF